jgi:hypothetical protein
MHETRPAPTTVERALGHLGFEIVLAQMLQADNRIGTIIVKTTWIGRRRHSHCVISRRWGLTLQKDQKSPQVTATKL